jgi:DNA invertase Pin-like site-specific DNA recombinase
MSSDSDAGKKATIYTRVSTATKSRYSDDLPFDQAPEVQEEPLRRLAAQSGWTITQVYADRINGSNENRPGLTHMMGGVRPCLCQEPG